MKTSVTLKNCILSFPALFTPTATELDEEKKYRATLIIERTVPARVSQIVNMH